MAESVTNREWPGRKTAKGSRRIHHSLDKDTTATSLRDKLNKAETKTVFVLCPFVYLDRKYTGSFFSPTNHIWNMQHWMEGQSHTPTYTLSKRKRKRTRTRKRVREDADEESFNRITQFKRQTVGREKNSVYSFCHLLLCTFAIYCSCYLLLMHPLCITVHFA